jgi:hypothetical protein
MFEGPVIRSPRSRHPFKYLVTPVYRNSGLAGASRLAFAGKEGKAPGGARRAAVVKIATSFAFVGVLLALLVPATADALTQPELEAEYPAALAWWGVTSAPQCGSIELLTGPVDPWGTGDGGTGGIATEPAPGETNVRCVLWIKSEGLTPCEATEAIRHEVGHLLGHGHSPDINNIMYPSLQPAVWCHETLPTIVLPPSEYTVHVHFPHHHHHHRHRHGGVVRGRPIG